MPFGAVQIGWKASCQKPGHRKIGNMPNPTLRNVRSSGGTMFMAFFSSQSGTSSSKSGLPDALTSRWSTLGAKQRYRTADHARNEKTAQEPATPAASEAERARRLRASFEDDLAHFLRAAASSPAE